MAATKRAGGGHSPAGLDVFKAQRYYVDRMLEVPGMKALLLDDETKSIVSLTYTQTQILAKEVVLVEDLRTKHERMVHLKAVVFLRPTKRSVRQLKDELEDPKYGEYHIFFSNICGDDTLRYLAEHDPKEVVREVNEYFADYFVVNPDCFHCDIEHSLALSEPRAGWSSGRGQKAAFKRALQGVVSSLLSLKIKPTIRYAANSDLALKFAHAVKDAVTAEGKLFSFGRQANAKSPLLLIYDRRDDPVSPLLTQWTYQAMIHELLGIEHNCVRYRFRFSVCLPFFLSPVSNLFLPSFLPPFLSFSLSLAPPRPACPRRLSDGTNQIQKQKQNKTKTA